MVGGMNSHLTRARALFSHAAHNSKQPDVSELCNGLAALADAIGAIEQRLENLDRTMRRLELNRQR